MRFRSLIYILFFVGRLAIANNGVAAPECQTLVSGTSTPLIFVYNNGGHSTNNYEITFTSTAVDVHELVYNFHHNAKDDPKNRYYKESRFKLPMKNVSKIFQASENRFVAIGDEIKVFEYFKLPYGKGVFRTVSIASDTNRGLVVIKNRSFNSSEYNNYAMQNTGASLYRVVDGNLKLITTLGVLEKPLINRHNEILSEGENFLSGLFSPDAKFFASFNDSKKLIIYEMPESLADSDSNNQIPLKPVFKMSSGGVTAFTFSPDNKAFAMIGDLGKITVLTYFQGRWSQSNRSLSLKTGFNPFQKGFWSLPESFKFGVTRYGTLTIEVKYSSEEKTRVYEL